MNMSIAAVSVRGVCRKLCQVGEGVSDCGLMDLDAELEQFAVGARRAPGAEGAVALPPENPIPMPQSDELKLQRCAAGRRNENRETRLDRIVIMHPAGMARVAENPQSFSTVHSFE